MNPHKEILDQYDQLKIRFEKLSANDRRKNGKMNIKALTAKDYELAQNQLMNYFTDLISRQENIQLILKAKLELKIWNLLTERISKILKYKIDQTHLGKNSQVIIQNLYSTLIEDLRNSFQFFRNIYSIIINYENEKDMNILISNILNFMGDIKKLKLILNKKFSEFKDIINIEGDSRKDASEALRFFNYALNNYPYNTRIYSNLGYVYREFLKDHMNSAYWFIRAMSCVDNELKKIKDNLEKDFNSIRKRFLKMDYIVDTNPGFLKYDLDYFPILFYRIMGILYMNIDVDKMDNLMSNFKIIIEKILMNYPTIPDHYKFNYEINGFIEQMAILSIFNVHYNLNSLADYSNEPEKIIISSNDSKTKGLGIEIGIYNHHVMKEHLNLGNEVKNSLKLSLTFLSAFIKAVTVSMSDDNISFLEKFLLIIFYWLSLNYDIYTLLIDDEVKRHLSYFNHVIQNDYEVKRVLEKENNNNSDFISKINNMILPIETTFFGFIPLNRFFVLNKKPHGVMKIDDIKDISLINKIVLMNFMNSFGLSAKDDEEIGRKFWKRNMINIKERQLNPSDRNSLLPEMKERFLMSNKMPINLNVKKVKPLILLDACNIAMRHGDRVFSTKGIQIVMDYFTSQGHKVLSFLPEYLFRPGTSTVTNTGSNTSSSAQAKKKRVIPDDINYLNKLYAEGLVIQTPPQDYDDSYCIQYAKQHNAYIVTNDMYRDYIENVKDSRSRETEKMWVKEKCISFTFNKNEFIPNPDSGFFREFNIKEYNKSKDE